MGKIKLILGASIAAFAALTGSVNAGVIAFDDAFAVMYPLAPGENADPTTFYLDSDGATFSGSWGSAGVVSGVGNGDIGNWNLEGTNGSAFLGCNHGTTCSPTVSFNSNLSSLSLDVGLPAFGWSADFLVEALINNLVVDSVTFNLTSNPSTTSDPTDLSNVGPWQTATFNGVFDAVRVTAAFPDVGFFSAFGIDNISYEVTPVPEPPEILLFVTGILGLFFARRKLKRGSSPVTG